LKDIFDAIALSREAFMGAGLDAPTVILLGTHDQGMLFLLAMRQKNQHLFNVGSSELADGSKWMECEVLGIAVRWPANRVATKDGSWSYF
jgi:hypothetical protein